MEIEISLNSFAPLEELVEEEISTLKVVGIVEKEKPKDHFDGLASATDSGFTSCDVVGTSKVTGGIVEDVVFSPSFLFKTSPSTLIQDSSTPEFEPVQASFFRRHSDGEQNEPVSDEEENMEDMEDNFYGVKESITIIFLDSSQENPSPRAASPQSSPSSLQKKKKKKALSVTDLTRYLVSKPSVTRTTRTSKKAMASKKGGPRLSSSTSVQ